MDYIVLQGDLVHRGDIYMTSTPLQTAELIRNFMRNPDSHERRRLAYLYEALWLCLQSNGQKTPTYSGQSQLQVA